MKRNLKELKLELVDWKQVELSCTQAMEDARKQLLLNKEMYEVAIVNIKKLGGLTIDEEIAKEKAEAEKQKEEDAEKDRLALENNEPR